MSKKALKLSKLGILLCDNLTRNLYLTLEGENFLVEMIKVRMIKSLIVTGRVLPYMGYRGMCRGIGYGF